MPNKKVVFQRTCHNVGKRILQDLYEAMCRLKHGYESKLMDFRACRKHCILLSEAYAFPWHCVQKTTVKEKEARVVDIAIRASKILLLLQMHCKLK